MKRTILVAVLLVTCILSATVGGTVAWFTDKVETGINTITAGDLDIEVTYTNKTVNDDTVTESTEDLFSMPELWEPGAVATAKLTVKNVGNLAFNYNMSVKNIKENGVKDAEGNVYKLSEALKIAYLTGDAANLTERADVLKAAQAANGTTFASFAKFGSLVPAAEAGNGKVAEETGMLVVYWEPTANDNNWNANNGKSFTEGDKLYIELGLNVEATQMMFEEDSFGNDYDSAIADLMVKYKADASVVPAGFVVDEDTNTLSINDAESLLYFGYVLDTVQAYENSEDYKAGHGYTSIWYANASAHDIKLGADIDLQGMILPKGLGNMSDFKLDGQNHVIKNAQIEYAGTSSAALFVGRNRGISNLIVENVHVNAPNIAEGSAAVVSSDANANIDKVTVRNSSVKGGKYTGAIVGYNYGSVTDCTIENCSVSGRYKTGGVVGYICSDKETDVRCVNNNKLTNVTISIENLLEGKSEVIGQVVGNWNAYSGECKNNTLTNVTGTTNVIGKTEDGKQVTTI